RIGSWLIRQLNALNGDFQVRGRGLMIGLEFPFPIKNLREKLLRDFHIFTGFSGQNTVRLLPPLSLSENDAARFVSALASVLENPEFSR
ncbi:MAG TPA: hypothetical protein PK167_01180, partial [Prolixibacteraceae bacterium]|nr:hypothetical protein [Prolixibacteraceae bacterium]